MKTSIPRIRRVRLKGGGDVTILRQDAGVELEIIECARRLAQQVRDEGEQPAGFVLMIIGDGNTCTADWRTPEAMAPNLLPAYTKDVLMRLDMIRRINDALYGPPQGA